MMQTAKEYGVEAKTKLVTYTSYLADLIKNGKLVIAPTGREVAFQDPYQLSRDLGETEAAREVIASCATLKELHLNREETVWAGNILMAQYVPKVMALVAERRIFNAKALDISTIVTASVSEYASLKAVATDVTILSLEDLILGAKLNHSCIGLSNA